MKSTSPLERKAKTKSEFHQGQIFAMAGGTPALNAIAANASGALWTQLKGRKCQVFSSDQRLAVAGGEASYYPDTSVAFGEPAYHGHQRDVISNPTLVIEVLSRSTARYDRQVKVPLYQRPPSIQDILLIAQDRPRVEHLTRSGAKWTSTTYGKLTDLVPLMPLNCSLALADIYANIAF